ncbi:TY-Chap domain-containing protein [Nocardia sp. CA-151230]|uniref:TY-Chap domain-containing protein n=1 Tax=Nocardia sp. CA-151230 TaxID=3239982 RepID=UPI003D92BA5E
MTDWIQFEAGLAEELAMLPAGALITIDTKAPDTEPGFAQFAQSEEKVVAELGAYADLDRDAGAAAPGAAVVLAAGWHPPDGNDHENWWVELPWPVTTATYQQLAAMVVIGLRDAFHVSSPTRLVYDAWNSNAGNRRFDLPLLGIEKQ